jgi:hypothetical protein
MNVSEYLPRHRRSSLLGAKISSLLTAVLLRKAELREAGKRDFSPKDQGLAELGPPIYFGFFVWATRPYVDGYKK